MQRFLDWMVSGRAVILGAGIIIATAVLLFFLLVGSPPRRVSDSYKPVPGFKHGAHTTVRRCTRSEFLLWSLLTLGVVPIAISRKLRSIRRRNRISRNIFPKDWFDAAKKHPLTRRIAEANDFYNETVPMREETITVVLGFGIWFLTMGFLDIIFSLTGVFLD